MAISSEIKTIPYVTQSRICCLKPTEGKGPSALPNSHTSQEWLRIKWLLQRWNVRKVGKGISPDCYFVSLGLPVPYPLPGTKKQNYWIRTGKDSIPALSGIPS